MSVLSSDAYTARRLEHASAEHLHVTSRRAFIGPIPEGWLKSHRKQWYKHYVSPSRAPTFTAARPITSVNAQPAENEHVTEDPPRPSSQSGQTSGLQAGDTVTSTTSLLGSQRGDTVADPDTNAAVPLQDHADGGPVKQRPTDAVMDGLTKAATNLASPKVHFSESTKLQLRAQAERLAARGHFRTTKVKVGEMMKVDRMLVRIEITQQSLGIEYDEKVSQGVETKSLDKWREFMVVCRKYAPKQDYEVGTNAILQLYKTRVIAAHFEDVGRAKKVPKAEIVLNPRAARVNLYSSLDKTLCVWTVEGARTTIYYLRPQSGATSVEWYTFLRGALGHRRAHTLQVNIPDLSLTLRLDDPFRRIEHSRVLAEAAEGDDDALVKAMSDERGAAGVIVARCIDMLKQAPEWADVLRAWADYGHIGLAWKRYDRLEWVYGAVEQRMYGTIAMLKTHDLELRPKDHYPTTIRKDHRAGNGESKGFETLEEPEPVEGFLIRLTSQKGHERRMGKMLYKKLYFLSLNQYLIFMRPARAIPPSPPKMTIRENGKLPSAKQITNEAPLTYGIDPYPLEDDHKHITWLDSGEGIKSTEEQHAHDREAAAEADRNAQMLLGCDGFIHLCDVRRVRKMHKGATPADQNLDMGDDVEFDMPPEEVDQMRRQDDGDTTEVDNDRVFELLMKNGLVIRLQAYNKAMRLQWMNRLRDLVKYWGLRAKFDMDLYKSVREQNLEALQIDERAEALVGSFAYKWEVSQSYASPLIYNMCGIAQCRTIHLSGFLFRKPRRHTTFTRCHVILSNGHLLIFRDTLRSRSGKKTVHIHHERIASISLKGCYLYSGLLTENDLLYENKTFDSNTPGHHALPKIYLEDGWTSTDEEAMTTFVIWHAKSKSWFRSSRFVDDVRDQESKDEQKKRWKSKEGQMFGQGRIEKKLTRVSQLGATGRSVVFKARSRAERDHWVMGIQVEIERLVAQEQAAGEDVRLVEENKKKAK